MRDLHPALLIDEHDGAKGRRTTDSSSYLAAGAAGTGGRPPWAPPRPPRAPPRPPRPAPGWPWKGGPLLFPLAPAPPGAPPVWRLRGPPRGGPRSLFSLRVSTRTFPSSTLMPPSPPKLGGSEARIARRAEVTCSNSMKAQALALTISISLTLPKRASSAWRRVSGLMLVSRSALVAAQLASFEKEGEEGGEAGQRTGLTR